MLSNYPFSISYGASDDRLGDFYIPALERAVSFDRTTGFFSSASLAIAAAGIARLIQNGGKMRLLCGAQLSEQDVEAVSKGADLAVVVSDAMVGCLHDPTDVSMKSRLEALAWLVSTGKLDIRVVLPKGKDGKPRPASEAREYYHPKQGVFRDADGNRLAFTGSNNESEDGWEWHYEVFDVYASWPRQLGADEIPALMPYVKGVERRFEGLWEGKEDDWIALDIPEAAKQKLLKFKPPSAPMVDPLEGWKPDKHGKPAVPETPPIEPPEVTAAAKVQADLAERVLFRFLREAPFLPNAHLLGIETSAVKPWPHQVRVVTGAVARYPESFLFSDEVGLGKTIEAGLALRQLVVSGRVKRALLLVPKSVLKQWQEELYEKFALNVPRYDGGQLLDVFGRTLPTLPADVWSKVDILLASSQLAKRQERQEEVLAAPNWDLVIVDEAHHARRKDFLTDRYRPNRLMELVAGTGTRPGLKDKTRCIYLLTATPMQVDPVEVWDLLRVIGLGGRWGALQENFIDFFEELRKPFDARNWDFLLDMVRDYLATGGTLDPAYCAATEAKLGFVDWETIKGLPFLHKRASVIAQLPKEARAALDQLVARHTPLRRSMWRNTRTLLRQYVAKGLLKANVPDRIPQQRWIDLRPGPDDEAELYHRIDEYISDFYQKYEAERKGLGFIMTVYRRRLTSSFYAMRRSLERRRDFLNGLKAGQTWLTDDDVEQDELDLDVSESMDGDEKAKFLGELHYIDDFIKVLGKLGADSKLGQLYADLNTAFQQRQTVIVFTQYTDTMDYLRDALRTTWGDQVACYSGRGGECWDGSAWVLRPKEDLKEAFRMGDEVKILLCTESASEGLNLQTCGVLINYDMPWNPMRVEQRIGRIDRIGQKHKDVWIWNYFYADTVEATIYQRLGDRIEWFVNVVGELQPILQKVAKVIQSTAMLKGDVQKKRLAEEIATLRREIEEHNLHAFDLDALVDDELPSGTDESSPVTLQGLEKALVQSASLGPKFKPHPTIIGAHLLDWDGQLHDVTFDPATFDRYPNTVELLTYGNRLLFELLASVPDPPSPDGPEGIGLFKAQTGFPIGLFLRATEGGVQPIHDLAALKAELASEPQTWMDVHSKQAMQLFGEAAERANGRAAKVAEDVRTAKKLAIVEGARQVLVRTALVEVALAAQVDLFEAAMNVSFGNDAVQDLKRHNFPFKPLLVIAEAPDLEATATDAYWQAVQGRPKDDLKRRWEALRRQATEIVERYVAWKKQGLGVDLPAGGVDVLPSRTWLATRPGVAKPGDLSRTAVVLPFRRILARDAKPFENCIPVYRSLKAAAGRFSEEQFVDDVHDASNVADPERYDWAELQGRTRPGRGLFIAQVVGESMNRRIPNGAWCVWRANPAGTRQGKVVLAQHRDIFDGDTGGQYTVKVYDSDKRATDDESWEHVRITLKPDSTEPGFEPLVFEADEAAELRIVAELVEVLGGGRD